MTKLWKRLLVLAVLALGLTLLGWHIGDVQHWVAVHIGLIHAGPDPYYNFWSGFGSNLGYITLVAGGVTVYRHHNCHVRWCPFLGRQTHDRDGVPTPYLACPLHHDDHKGSKRAVSHETIREAQAHTRRAA